MNRNTIQRLLVIIGVAAGLITLTAGQASAGLVLNNHSEPTLHAS